MTAVKTDFIARKEEIVKELSAQAKKEKKRIEDFMENLNSSFDKYK